MSIISSRITHEGQRNATLEVTGRWDGNSEEYYEIINIKDLEGNPSLLKLEDLQYACEPGLIVRIWWESNPNHLISSVFNCGKQDYKAFAGRSNPKNEGHTGGIVISFYSETEIPKYFTLLLD